MGDRLRAGIPSRYVTSQLGQLSLASLRGRTAIRLLLIYLPSHSMPNISLETASDAAIPTARRTHPGGDNGEKTKDFSSCHQDFATSAE